MPTPEATKAIRDSLSKAEDGIRRFESEILMMEKAGIDATAQRIELRNLKDQASKLRAVYG